MTSHCLGSGSFATVHLALDTVQHRQVACKIIKTRKEENTKKVWKEVRILMALNHVRFSFLRFIQRVRIANAARAPVLQPNINKIHDVIDTGRTMSVVPAVDISYSSPPILGRFFFSFALAAIFLLISPVTQRANSVSLKERLSISLISSSKVWCISTTR